MKKVISTFCIIFCISGCTKHKIEKKKINPTIQQTKLAKRITEFAIKKYHVKPEIAIQFGNELAKTKYPKTLTAIAARESGFNAEAKGKLDDTGAFQVRESQHGKVPKNIKGQVKQAEKVLKNKLIGCEQFWKGVERYNGSGKKARQYARDIKILRAEI